MQMTGERMRQSSWPNVFLIKPLAQMVFLCIPPLQVRQWIRDASIQDQTQLCEWMPREILDTEMIAAILAKDNVDAFRVLRLSRSYLWQGQLRSFAFPSILNWVITPNQTCYLESFFVTMCAQQNVTKCVPFANFKVLSRSLVPYGSMTNNIFLKIAKEPSDNKYAFIDCIINELHWEVAFYFEDDFDLKLWNLIRHKVSATNPISICWLATMPIEIFKTLDSLLYESKQLEVWNTSVHACNWDVANYLWQPDYQSQFLGHFYWYEFANERETRNKRECHDDVFFEMLGNGKMMSKTLRPRWTKFEFHDRCILNSALKYLQSGTVFSPGSMAFAIGEYFKKIVNTRAFDSIVWMFECACLTGRYHIVRALWGESPFSQQQVFTTKLRQCRFSSSRKLFAFAWSVIGQTINGDEQLRWIRAAYNNINCKLWNFLNSKNKLIIALFLKEQTLGRSFLQDNLLTNFCMQPVAMLETIWDQLIGCGTNLNDLVFAAVRNDKHEVATFLNNKQVRIPNHLLCSYVQTLCRFELWSFLSQTKIESEKLLYQAFASANTDTCNAIWRIKPFADPTSLLVDYKNSLSLHACMFLLRVGAVPLDTMLATIQTNTLLADNIRAMTYCACDETTSKRKRNMSVF